MTAPLLPTDDDDTIVYFDDDAPPLGAEEIDPPEASIVVVDEFEGPQGSQGHQGVPGQPWTDRGPFTPGVDYPAQSIVHVNGSTYGSETPVPASPIFDAAAWQLWAAQGGPGPQGVQGVQGAMTYGQPRYVGQGPPPDVIVGAAPHDWYLDDSSGLLYELL